MAQNKLNTSKIRSIKPIIKEQNISDGGSLWLRVLPASKGGSKSWYFRFTYQKKRDKLSLGVYPAVGLAEARRLRDKAVAALATGRNPKYFVGHGDRVFTVLQLAQLWRDAVLVEHKDGGHKIYGAFEHDVFPFFGDAAAASITHDQIIDIVSRVVQRGAKAKGAKLLSWLRSMFGFGIRRRIISADPTSHLTSKDLGAGEKSCERNLSFDEVSELAGKVLDAKLPPRVEAAMWFLLATGVRPIELITATPDMFNLQDRVWEIPNNKSGRVHYVPLSNFALFWLSCLFSHADDKWIFPGEKNRKGKCVAESYLRKIIGERIGSVKRSKSTAGFGKLALSGGAWKLYDLRRTMATRMGDLRVDPHVIEACLNHRVPGVKGVYQRQIYLDERIEAYKQWGERLSKLVF